MSSVSSEPLAEVNDALALLEAERPVGKVAEGVVQESIAAKLREAPGARPGLDGGHQGTAHTRPPRVLVHPPALQEGARLLIHPIGEWAHAGLGEATQPAIIAGRDKYDLVWVGQQLLQLAGQLIQIRLGPQRGPHPGVLGFIVRLSGTDIHEIDSAAPVWPQS